MDLTRRQTLFGLSALAGHALFPGVLEGFARLPQDAGVWTPELVSTVQGAVLAEVVETIVPRTSTPGAKDARVHVFVDSALKRCATADQQQAALAALDGLGAGFAELPPAARESRLKAIDAPTFALFRDLALIGYFTSEIGATQALAYLAVPGAYRGCLDLKPGQKAWAM
jgi:glucoside 3-dehydrogenase (cytochrome c) hitch-hiker subunit